ncbi:AHA1, activator of heat shock 90kDa protein ATPase [Balamuthia mandrillaris]
MAKVGEGDPRWIVAERTDGTNVNNWHWTEKNLLPWAKKRAPELFEGQVLYEGEEGCLKLTKVDSLDGEANVNTRKGKVFHFYELNIKLKWEGTWEGENVEGTIKMPDVSFENSDEEHEIKVTVDKNPKKNPNILSVLRAQGIPTSRKALSQLLSEIKEQKGDLKEQSTVIPLTAAQKAELEKQKRDEFKRQEAEMAKMSIQCNGVDTDTVELTVPFRARSSDIYECLMDPNRVAAYTQSSVTLEPKAGGAFAFFSGNVQGTFVEVIPNKKIVQKWRTSTWPEDHFSSVTITLEDTSDGCSLRLKQQGVPSEEVDRTRGAWMDHFFNRIKGMFGYGFGFS